MLNFRLSNQLLSIYIGLLAFCLRVVSVWVGCPPHPFDSKMRRIIDDAIES
jgi:hypothetical protein